MPNKWIHGYRTIQHRAEHGWRCTKLFKHPNAATVWLTQIWELKIREISAQKYMDQFKSLATKLGWNLQEKSIIYQFKMGLPQWILTQLSIAKSNFMLNLIAKIYIQFSRSH